MNADSTAAELLATYQRVGQEAFAAMLAQSGLSAPRMLELAAQVTNLPIVPDELMSAEANQDK